MSWKLEASGTVQGYGTPTRMLYQQVSAEWRGDGEVELCSVRYHATMDNPRISWPQTHITVGPDRLRQGRSAHFAFSLPFESSFIRAVEDWRLGRSDPLHIQVRANLYFRRVTDLPLPVPDRQAKPQGPAGIELLSSRRETFRELSAPEHGDGYLPITINRDRWLDILKTVGWEEFEVFELPVRRIGGQERLAEGLKHLRLAQTAFRQGQWATTAVEARKACEAAATVDGPEANRKHRLEALVNEVLPSDQDSAKRDMLEGMMKALVPLRNQGAHANIRMAVEREDAELSLTVAIAIFRYMGEALSARPPE